MSWVGETCECNLSTQGSKLVCRLGTFADLNIVENKGYLAVKTLASQSRKAAVNIGINRGLSGLIIGDTRFIRSTVF